MRRIEISRIILSFISDDRTLFIFKILIATCRPVSMCSASLTLPNEPIPRVFFKRYDPMRSIAAGAGAPLLSDMITAGARGNAAEITLEWNWGGRDELHECST